MIHARTQRMITAMGLLVLASSRAVAAEFVTLDELLAGWGTDLNQVDMQIDTLEPGLHVIRGAGGATLASIGADGVLLVDDQYDAVVERLASAVASLGGGAIDIVINTHAHFDHADGNPKLGAAGAQIIAHRNARERMTLGAVLDYGAKRYRQPAYPANGLPTVTFDDNMTLHFNKQTIELMYLGDGHTNGDVSVWFREANVVHVGDLYVSPWPYIDAANGGDLGSYVSTVKSLAARISADTRVVSGHRPDITRDDLLEFADRLHVVHGRLQAMAERGLTIQEVIADDPTADLIDADVPPVLFLSLAYQTVQEHSAR